MPTCSDARFPAFLIQSVCLGKQHKSNDKQQYQEPHAKILPSQLCAENCHGSVAHKIGYKGNNGRSNGICTFSEGVHHAKVFAAALRWNNLCKVGAAQCLNAALEHPHQHRQQPELPQLLQKHSKQGNAAVAQNADFYQQCGIIFCRQPPKDNGAGERHNLSHQQGQQQARAVQHLSRR